MGAWDVDSFDNDTAGDWAYGLDEVRDLSLVEAAFSAVLEIEDGYLDSDVASEAIAACEVVARLRGNFGKQDSYTETVDAWVSTNPQSVPAALRSLSARVLDRVLAEPSELLELWAESDEFDRWKSCVLQLKARAAA